MSDAMQQRKNMRVLIACEFSGVVREAFRHRGHDAWSCDLLPAEDGSRFHIRGDVRMQAMCAGSFDLMIAHPPCTHLAVSGARWFNEKRQEQAEALDFVRFLLDAPIARIALENPVSIISSRIRKPDQTIQPWMFGHGETKATCLWLKNLPKLIPTHKRGDLFAAEEPTERVARVHLEPPGPDRWKNRSRTYTGIAEAMAEQWGALDSEIAA
jgi:site-specific DNA-cytosine methylase